MLVEVVLERRRRSRGCALAGRQLAEALDVDRDGGQDVLQVGLGLSPVAAVAHAVAMGGFADGALDAGPHRVALVPGRVLLVSTVTDLQFEQFARGEAHGTLAVAGGGAGGTGGVGLALRRGEAGNDERGGAGRGRGVGAVPPLADLGLRAGDFLAVVAGAEVVAGVALLVAVLAGAVAGQRPDQGDPVLAPGPFHVHQGGVAAVRQVLAGEQAPGAPSGRGSRPGPACRRWWRASWRRR